MPNPTNKDIIKLLTMNHEETSGRLKAVEEQVKYTNGRVSAMEDKWARREAVEDYLSQQGARSSSNPKTDWDWKVVLAIILTLATIFAGVANNV